MTIENQYTTTTPQVLTISSNGTTPITNVTVKNCIIINGSTSSSAVVVSDRAGTAGYFNNITFQNNSVQKAYIGVYFLATIAAGNGSGTLVTGNDLNTSGANAIRLVGLYAQGVDGITISNNNIGNFTVGADGISTYRYLVCNGNCKQYNFKQYNITYSGINHRLLQEELQFHQQLQMPT